MEVGNIKLDIEKQQPPALAKACACRSKKLKTLVCVAIGYALYRLATLPQDVAVPSEEHSWALDIARANSESQHLSPNKLEELFLSVPDSASALASSRHYATHPHLASSEEDYQDAKDILKVFQEQFDISVPKELPVFPAGTEASRKATLGINKLNAPNAWIDVYYPIMNTPLDHSLQILGQDGKAVWNADLEEDGDPLDHEAAKYKDSIPAWHGFSRNGEAEGQLIYANYGLKEDYDELVSLGTNFTGKVVIARYGEIFRGLKIKRAQELGAVGVLIYSDPRDDGTVTVENGYEPYPYGPARNPTSVQRGSVQFLSLYPGDPTTPGYPAYENATRVEGENIPKIPSLPISWANAEKLLAEISKDDARKLTGKASAAKIKLVNHVDDKVMPIWNTMAAIPGHIKNETVLIGCHRDAWVMGAADPTSGTVSLIEIVRGFGTLLKHGWKPLRNIVIASWDAEEYGLVGSTEWAEDFPEWIQDNVVSYLNVDVSTSGSRWVAAGSPSLAHFIQRNARDIPHPTQPGRTLWDAREDIGPYTEGVADFESFALYAKAENRRSAAKTGITPLGSGSDFTAFLQRLGIASMDQSFSTTPSDAPYHYHSIYDSQRWQEIYADPGFHRHIAVAKHLGLTALRMSESWILPLNTTQYALELDEYLDEIENLASDLSLSVNFSPLRHSIAKLQHASDKLDHEKVTAENKFRKLLEKLPHKRQSSWYESIHEWINSVLHIGPSNDGHKIPVRKILKAAKRLSRANAKLVAFEKGFLHEDGIKDREWYKHLGVAPGKWLGYGATTLPAVYDALVFDKNSTLAKLEADRLTELLKNLAHEIRA